jgi:hypothetical protein
MVLRKFNWQYQSHEIVGLCYVRFQVTILVKVVCYPGLVGLSTWSQRCKKGLNRTLQRKAQTDREFTGFCL